MILQLAGMLLNPSGRFKNQRFSAEQAWEKLQHDVLLGKPKKWQLCTHESL